MLVLRSVTFQWQSVWDKEGSQEVQRKEKVAL
jgi:hypothetical protein